MFRIYKTKTAFRMTISMFILTIKKHIVIVIVVYIRVIKISILNCTNGNISVSEWTEI